MSRKKVTRNLPGLDTLSTPQPRIPEHVHHAEYIANDLKQIIVKIRRRDSIPFYSLRDVAAHYGVSSKTALCAYRLLRSEGLLRIERGAQTLLTGRRHKPRRPLHGRIAIPVQMDFFRIYSDRQLFIIQLIDEFLKRDFAVIPIYDLAEELNPDDFLRQIDVHQPDWVLWLLPFEQMPELLRVIMDRGINLATLHDRPGQHFPGESYFLSYHDALRQGLEEWKGNGIRRVIVPGRITEENRSLTHAAPALLKHSGLDYTFIPAPEFNTLESLGRFAASLPQGSDTGILFDDDIFFGRMLNRHPSVLIQLLKRQRCVVGHPILSHRPFLKGITVDAITNDWNAIARHIANDICTNRIFTFKTPVTFHARWRPQISATQI